MTNRTVAIILAGGEGTRLQDLTATAQRAKPAVPFMGENRIIDYSLANLTNSGVARIFVATQFASHSLHMHLDYCWSRACRRHECVTPLFPSMLGDCNQRYVGTANAVWQNWKTITAKYNVDTMVVAAGDHVYVMDYSQTVRWHREKTSDLTVCIHAVPVELAANTFGVVRIDSSHRIVDFLEKPPLDKIPHIPGRDGYCWASMGIYIGKCSELELILQKDAEDPLSSHDFGHDILRKIITSKRKIRLYAYPLDFNEVDDQPGPFWQDVGTVYEYYDLHMRLVGPTHKRPLNRKNPNWVIPTFSDGLCAADIANAKVEHAQLAAGVTIDDGAHVTSSSIGTNVRIESNAEVHACILIGFLTVGVNAKIRHVICDKEVDIPAGEMIGYDRARDAARFYTETLSEAEGTYISLIPKGYKF